MRRSPSWRPRARTSPHAEPRDADRAGAVGPTRQQLPSRRDVLERLTLVGDEVFHDRSHTADHPAPGKEVRRDRQESIAGDLTHDLTVRFAQAERVVYDDDTWPGSVSGRNLQYRVDAPVGRLNADVGHCALLS